MDSTSESESDGRNQPDRSMPAGQDRPGLPDVPGGEDRQPTRDVPDRTTEVAAATTQVSAATGQLPATTKAKQIAATGVSQGGAGKEDEVKEEVGAGPFGRLAVWQHPPPAETQVLTEVELQARGWSYVPAPGPEASQEEIAAWDAPVPAHILQEWFDEWDAFDDGYWTEPGHDDLFDEHESNLIAAGIFTEVYADPDPVPMAWPLPEHGRRLPVGVAPRTDGEYADAGAHARRRADWQTLYDLERIDAGRTDPYTLLEAIEAWRRVESLAAYHQRILADRLVEHGLRAAPERQAHEPLAAEVTHAEVSSRLGITRQRAMRMVATGAAFTHGAGFLTGAALRDGSIDAAKADLLIERTAHLPLELALDVQEAVLENAPLRTHPQLERDIAKQIAALDPEGFSERHRWARRDRRVNAPQALADGMARTSIIWSATDAAALHTALEAAARSRSNAGDGRTLAQLRADAMATLAHTALATGRIGPCDAGGADPATSGVGAAGVVRDENEGPGACTCTTASAYSHSSHSGAHSPFPGSSHPGAGCSHGGAGSLYEGTSHLGAGSHPGSSGGETSGGEQEEPGPFTPADVLTPFILGSVGGARAQIRITVPLSTLMGTSAEAGELEGYGPIPAEVARAWAAGGTWKRLVVDPTTDRVVEATSTRYEPPPWLREQVLTNTPYCVAPGCNVQSRHTDLDHGVPHPEGPTEEWNLHPLCRAHHRLKTHSGFRYHSPSPGVYEWSMPSGHRYRTDGDGIELLPPRGPDPPPAPDPPPF